MNYRLFRKRTKSAGCSSGEGQFLKVAESVEELEQDALKWGIGKYFITCEGRIIERLLVESDKDGHKTIVRQPC